MRLLLKLLGFARWIGRGLRAVVRWIFADWRNGPLLMGAIFAAAHIFLIDPAERSRRAEAEKGWAAEIIAHEGTVENYRIAAAEARRIAAANARRVKAEQDAITEEIVDDYQARIADARRRAAAVAGRLRRDEIARADPGGPGAIDLPGPGDPASRVDEAPGENRLPPAGAEAGELSLGDALIATEQAIQLDALIAWVEAQAAVSNNPDVAGDPR